MSVNDSASVLVRAQLDPGNMSWYPVTDLCLFSILGSSEQLRCCRWVLSETKRLSNNDALELEPLLQRGAQALRDRPVLFKYCAREVATARHNALFQR